MSYVVTYRPTNKIEPITPHEITILNLLRIMGNDKRKGIAIINGEEELTDHTHIRTIKCNNFNKARIIATNGKKLNSNTTIIEIAQSNNNVENLYHEIRDILFIFPYVWMATQEPLSEPLQLELDNELERILVKNINNDIHFYKKYYKNSNDEQIQQYIHYLLYAKRMYEWKSPEIKKSWIVKMIAVNLLNINVIMFKKYIANITNLFEIDIITHEPINMIQI